MFFAKVETKEPGDHYKMEGPKTDEKEAFQDLDYIRSAAEGEATRAEGLHSMTVATKKLQDEVKAETQVAKLEAKKAASKDHDNATAATRGCVKAADSECFNARIQYVENSVLQEIAGPPVTGTKPICVTRTNRLL